MQQVECEDRLRIKEKVYMNRQCSMSEVETNIEEMKEYMPDFCVTVIYPEDPAETEYLYYEQNGMFTTMVNWLHGQMSVEEIEQLRCEILIPQESNM